MAIVKPLKIGPSGLPTELEATTDELELLAFRVQGGGPIVSGTGIDMNSQSVTEVLNLSFNDPATATINQTAGALIVDNVMAKDRENVLTSSSSVLFPVITDAVGQVDAFRLPALAGAPSAAPAAGGSGFIVWDSVNMKQWAWNGTAWDDLSSVSSAESIDGSGFSAGEDLTARDVVYISAADTVSKAKGDAVVTAQAVGFALAAAASAAPVVVRSAGVVSGFTGLTAGAKYFLSPATAGSVTSTLPVGAGNVIVQVGYAKSATAMHVQIQSLGRRA